MDHIHSLTHALVNRTLCFFVGTGFSKHISANVMPGWRDLLQRVCQYAPDPTSAAAELAAHHGAYPLEDCAQMLEIAFIREGRSMREAIAAIVGAVRVDSAAVQTVASFFSQHYSRLSIITTNYDMLIEREILPNHSYSTTEGKPVVHRANSMEVLHLHGSLELTSSMVVTTQDYYEFINLRGYQSQRAFTMMHDNTVVFLGYSLSDPNLKAILNAYRLTNRSPIARGRLFYVTRGSVSQGVRDYYELAYGLSVIEQTEIDGFLSAMGANFPQAEQAMQDAEPLLNQVISGTHFWTPSYLHSRESFFRIMAAAATFGSDLQSPGFLKMLGDIVAKKEKHTEVFQAWDQYEHLSAWLIYLASIVDIDGTSLEPIFLKAARQSMATMSGNGVSGYSWAAFRNWHEGWKNITFKNRQMLAKDIRGNPPNLDALAVIQ